MKGILAVVLTLVAGVVGGQPVPGIDGVWRLDPNKSPGYPLPISASTPDVILTVRQTNADITIERRSQGVIVTHYRINEQTENGVGGLRTTARAEWQGGRLVVAGERPAANGTVVPYRTTFTLSGDSTMLTIEERVSAATTEFVSKQVFVRVGD